MKLLFPQDRPALVIVWEPRPSRTIDAPELATVIPDMSVMDPKNELLTLQLMVGEFVAPVQSTPHVLGTLILTVLPVFAKEFESNRAVSCGSGTRDAVAPPDVVRHGPLLQSFIPVAP